MIASASSLAVVGVLFMGWSVSTLGLFNNASAPVAASESSIFSDMGGTMQSASASFASFTEQLKQVQQRPEQNVPKEAVIDTGTVVTIPSSE